MKVSIQEKNDKDIYIEIDITDMTLLHPLVEELLKDKSVDIAEYKLGHPELDSTVLHVRTKTGKPETAIRKATKAIMETYSDLRTKFEKEL
jgi:DNA-directed RNA polymerase subunit L